MPRRRPAQASPSSPCAPALPAPTPEAHRVPCASSPTSAPCSSGWTARASSTPADLASTARRPDAPPPPIADTPHPVAREALARAWLGGLGSKARRGARPGPRLALPAAGSGELLRDLFRALTVYRPPRSAPMQAASSTVGRKLRRGTCARQRGERLDRRGDRLNGWRRVCNIMAGRLEAARSPQRARSRPGDRALQRAVIRACGGSRWRRWTWPCSGVSWRA